MDRRRAGAKATSS